MTEQSCLDLHLATESEAVTSQLAKVGATCFLVAIVIELTSARVTLEHSAAASRFLLEPSPFEHIGRYLAC